MNKEAVDGIEQFYQSLADAKEYPLKFAPKYANYLAKTSRKNGTF